MRRLFAGCLAALALGGCQHIDQRVNETWPPKDTLEKRLEAVERSLVDLAALGEPGIFVSLKPADWKGQLESRIVETVPQVTAVVLKPSRQEILADIEFSGTFTLDNGKSIALGGSVLLNLAPSFGDRRLTVGISATRVHLTQARYADWLNVPKDIVQLVNTALNRWLPNINGTLKDYVAEVQPEFFQTFDPKSISGDKQLTGSYGNPIKIGLEIGHTTLLVDTDGIHVLGRLVVETPDAIKRAIAQLNAGGSVETLNDDVVALNALCPDAERFKDATGGTDLVKACARLAQLKLSGKSVLVSRFAASSEDDFEKKFKELRGGLVRNLNDYFSLTFEAIPDSGAAVTKKLGATAINTVGTAADFGLHYAFPDSAMPFNENLNTGDAPDLHCGDIAPDCRPGFRCPGLPDDGKPVKCDYGCSGRSCPRDCGWDIGCHAWKPVCEIERVLQIAACEAGKGVCIAACLTEHLAINTVCEAQTAAQRALCQLNQDWLRAWANMNIANVKGTVDTSNAKLSVAISSFSDTEPALWVDDALTTAELRAQVAAETDVAVALQYTPLDLGHALCVAQWTGGIRAKAYAPSQRLVARGSIEVQPLQDAIQLWLTTNVDQPITVKTWPSPVEALFRQNPQFAVICFPFAMAGVTVQILGELEARLKGKQNSSNLLRDTFTYDVKTMRTPIVIDPVGIDVPAAASFGPGSRLKLYPTWNPRAIVFRLRK